MLLKGAWAGWLSPVQPLQSRDVHQTASEVMFEITCSSCHSQRTKALKEMIFSNPWSPSPSTNSTQQKHLPGSCLHFPIVSLQVSPLSERVQGHSDKASTARRHGRPLLFTKGPQTPNSFFEVSDLASS